MIRNTLFFLLFLMSLYANSDWESSYFVWDFGLIQGCDRGLLPDPETYFKKDRFDPELYQEVQKGDVVWVRPCHLKKFYKKVLPKIKHPFVLVVCDGDESFPSNVGLKRNGDELIEHPLIVHIFAQNCDYRGKSHKVSPLPIGIDFHTLGYKEALCGWGDRASPSEQEKELTDILGELKPTYLRKKGAFVDFQHNNTMKANFHRDQEFGEDRLSIFEKLQKTGLIAYDAKMKRSDLWRRKGEYAFSISPPGNGLDCHRTWEDLVLGCIVIVKSSPLDPLYEGLPVVIVNDWGEVTEENLTRWLDQYPDAFTNPSYREKLTNAYWLGKIRSSLRLVE